MEKTNSNPITNSEPQTRKPMNKRYLIVLVSLLVLIAALGIGSATYKAKKTSSNQTTKKEEVVTLTPTSTITAAASQIAATPMTQPSTKALITGAVYPIPCDSSCEGALFENMKVCAVNIATNKETCTANLIESKDFDYFDNYPLDTGNKGYILSVEPGSYKVYSMQTPNGSKFYYDEYAKCNFENGECESKNKYESNIITLNVKAGETLSKITAGDIYHPVTK